MFQRTGGPFLSRDKKGIPPAGEAVNLLHEPSTVISKADIQKTLYKLDHNTFRRRWMSLRCFEMRYYG
ncbi:hypothetical protein HMPREF0372_01792 [Flavonifractor plautii ATCC 29863]|uniref:Uncharacterized protein n=1 Tax=Flavonifractor plautii ATCC 29863 TaxID=411475 RepID=G9YQJ9_FLAPL|nr:hypothetical protein HMPREF0372_01792 [Flavonifractor plautii ATCC 29863]